MKKLICIIVSISLFFALIIPSYADYRYPVVPTDLLTQAVINTLGRHDHVILNVDCRSGSLDTSAISWISYDTLSGISVDLTSLGQVVYNSANDAYFISVPYTDTLGTRHYGTLGSASGGYVYGTHANRSGGGGGSTSTHKISTIGTTGYYWIDTTALASCEYHYVDNSTFENIRSTCLSWYRDGSYAIVRESSLLNGTPCYVLKVLKNGTWVGTVCDQYGPIYCSAVNSGPIVVDDGTGGTGSGSTFDDTDVVNAIDSVYRAINSVDDTLSYVSTYLSRLNNNFINFANDFKLNYEMQSNDLSNIYTVLVSMYQSFYERFEDLDLTYYNDAEIQLYNGEYLDWSESDRGQISIEANDIGTLELLGFPDMDGYKATHSFGGDITIQRNDGTFFPDKWELPGGTVSMPAIESAYASITVTAPVGSVISVAGNTHTFDSAAAYTVNVGFGQYQIDVSYEDAGDIMTTSYTVDVDGYNDYAVNFGYTPGGFVVTVTSSLNSTAAKNRYITINGRKYTPYTFYGSGKTGEFQLDVGSVIKFSADSGCSFAVYVDGEKMSGTEYTVVSDCSIAYSAGAMLTTRWDITTSNTGSIVGDFDTPTVTVTANTVTSVPVTIERLVRLSGGDWVAYDILGNSYSFSPVSELALNRSFVTHIYTADEIADLNNFPSGYWQVSWSGESHYITIKFEEYSKFFLWLNRFLINFRDTLYTKMEDISVTASGDVIVTSGDYSSRLDRIIELLSGQDPIACSHVYTADEVQPATCVLPGLVVYTCSNCGNSYSEIVDPYGHDWLCTDHVSDELDDEGNVISVGYDIYTCSRCQEVYKDFDGSGAPDAAGGSIFSLITKVFSRLGSLVGGILSGILNYLDNLLTRIDDLISDFNTRTQQVLSFGGDYPLWLAGVWGILPEDLQIALGFCVVALILGILGKKLVFS